MTYAIPVLAKTITVGDLFTLLRGQVEESQVAWPDFIVDSVLYC